MTDDERAFARTLEYLGWGIMAGVIAGVVGMPAAQSASAAAVGYGVQQVLQLSNFVGRAQVIRQTAKAVATGETAPAAMRWIPSPGGVIVPELGIESLPTTIAVPKPPPPTIPWAPPQAGKVPFFEEAAADIIGRAPVVVQGGLRGAAAEVGGLYRDDWVFAIAKSTDAAITARVQEIVSRGITDGLSEADAIIEIMKVNADWTRAYAQTIYRTNINTARTQGRFQQSAKPGMELILPVMVFNATPDDRTRPNHMACHGAAAAPGDKLWDRISPPLGYNCRCSVDLVSWEMARRMGLVNSDGSILVRYPKSGGGPDEGFIHSGRSRWAA